jgi:exoribonuclease R
MGEYIIEIDDRSYSKYSINSSDGINIILNPIEYKLFHRDRFILNSGDIQITNSDVRNRILPGLLVLNKTYGRENKSISGQTYTMSAYKKLGKLLYKFIPYDKHLPSFLVPYEIKKMDFSKVQPNMYVLVKYSNWDYKHPIGKLTQIIGNVDILDNYYEYQLYCKELNNSIQNFINITNNKLNNISSLTEQILEKNSNINDRRSWKTFTIDPSLCTDYDDAFSIMKINNTTMISIYISNVPLVLDQFELWTAFTERISTIYLPNRKKSMLPPILSDDLCSLVKSHDRFAFTLDITINENYEIISSLFSNTLINIKENFIYEEPKLLTNNDYNHLLVVTKEIQKKYEYTTEIKDSHDLVEHWMLLMNIYTAERLEPYKKGIFRITTPIENKFMSAISGQYIDAETTPIGTHNGITSGKHVYLHITSPIRRLVDLLNMIKFQSIMNLGNLSYHSELFYEMWKKRINEINDKMRKIKSVQNNCMLLNMIQNNEEMLSVSYDGYIFDKLTNKYSVYIPELKLVSNYKSDEELDIYSSHKFKLYLFIDEDNFYKKVRLLKL